jgi:hypothetical protein
MQREKHLCLDKILPYDVIWTTATDIIEPMLS